MKSAEGNECGGLEEVRVWSPLELAEMKTGRRLGQIRRAEGFSGRKRVRVTDRSVCYHVMSRTVNGDHLLRKVEKEAFRRMMWRMAKFAGVEVLTYAVMDNHFHILLKVPEQAKWLQRFEGDGGEEKLFAHLGLVYSTQFLAQLRREVGDLRKRDEEEAVQMLLARFKRRFCDLSLFVKELKERFSRWYNKQHDRKGTLWMDRFKSVMVESGQALQVMAAYIDLNPVRAGLVEDPAMYEWSGYGEAVGGSKRSRRGLAKALGVPQDRWHGKTHPYYRKWLYAEGYEGKQEIRNLAAKTSKGDSAKVREGFSAEQVRGAMSDEVSFPLLMIRKRVKSFSQGIAIGSEDYVKGMAARYQAQFERQKVRTAKRMKGSSGVYLMRG